MQDRFAWPLMCWWLVLAAAVVVVRTLSEGIIDTGDGIMHFLFARNAPQHPEVFLDPWAKPLFTFLSAPFAQLGLWGMTLFNALCFVGTAWAADGMLKHSALAARWLFAPALLLMPEYGNMVQAGMTEVLFAMVAMMAARSLWEERWRQAAILISLLPFARPEYVAVLPFFVGWLLWNRQWRALPWLLFGHAIHATAAWAILGDPLWAMRSPSYGDASELYGRGYLMYFVDRLNVILGPGTEWLLAFCMPVSIAMALAWPRERGLVLRSWLFLLLPFLAILMGHSILWWKGWKASLGLVRVLATGAPFAMAFVAFTLGSVGRNLLSTMSARVAVSTFAGILFFTCTYPMVIELQPQPVLPDAQETFLSEAGDEALKMEADHPRVLIFDPQIFFRTGLDMFDPRRVQRYPDHHDPEGTLGLREGDLLVWDAHFGYNEGRTSIDTLLTNGRFRIVLLKVPPERWIMLGGQPMEVWFMERRDTRYARHTAPLYPLPDEGGAKYVRLDTVQCPAQRGSRLCFATNEFPLDFGDLPTEVGDLAYSELSLSAEFHVDAKTAREVELVFSEEDEKGKITYWTFPIVPGEVRHSWRYPPRPEGVRAKLYIYNKSGRPFSISDLRIDITQVVELD